MRDLGSHEADGAEARIVGNLAGVVEWANDAFARLSGIGLDETLDKPVGRLLERAALDLEIVDFVAQHFFEGQICRVAFPFERPDGRRIDVVLEVEALRDALGEIDRFRAIAREAPSAALEPTPPVRPTSSSGHLEGPRTAIALNEAVRRGLDAALDALAALAAGGRAGAPDVEPARPPQPTFSIELDLAPDLPLVEVETRPDAAAAASAGPVEALVGMLFEAARLAIEESGNAGGVVTLSTSRLAPRRRFVSKVHAIAACPPERAAAGDVVLELHDTADALAPAHVAALVCGGDDAAETNAPSARLRALAEVCRRARALGARVHLDATPGCGNQLLVLFAAAQAR